MIPKNDGSGIEFSENGKVLIRVPKDYQGEYIIPDGVVEIGDEAFRDCESLISISIPSSIAEIGHRPFYGCKNLTKISTSLDNQTYCSIDGVLFSKDKSTLIIYPNGKSGAYKIPNSVSAIEHKYKIYRFVNGVRVPENVKTDYGIFANCLGLTSIDIPESVIELGDNIFSGCSNLASVTIGNRVTRIGDSAFADCFGLTEIVIPYSVSEIGAYAFARCRKMSSVTLKCQISSLEKGTFCECDALESIILPDSIEYIDNEAFAKCKELTSISIPDSVTDIRGTCNCFTGYYGPFEECSSLSSVTFGKNIRYIGENAFRLCKNLKTITLPDSLEYIGDHTFEACSNLSTIILGKKITKIGKGVFDYCQSIEEIIVPKGSKRQYEEMENLSILKQLIHEKV